MKLLFCILFLLHIGLYSVAAQDETIIEVSLGLPIAYNTDWAELNLVSRLAYQKKLTEKTNHCIGINYDNVNLLPASTWFAFDRVYFGVYYGVSRTVKVSKAISIDPEFDIGYSLVKYKLNKFTSVKGYISGSIMRFGFKLNQELSESYNVKIGLFNTTMLRRMENKIEFPYPSIYSTRRYPMYSNLMLEFVLGVKI